MEIYERWTLFIKHIINDYEEGIFSESEVDGADVAYGSDKQALKKYEQNNMSKVIRDDMLKELTAYCYDVPRSPDFKDPPTPEEWIEGKKVESDILSKINGPKEERLYHYVRLIMLGRMMAYLKTI